MKTSSDWFSNDILFGYPMNFINNNIKFSNPYEIHWKTCENQVFPKVPKAEYNNREVMGFRNLGNS